MKNEECVKCAWFVDGKCTNRDAFDDIGDCGHYDGCGGYSPKKKEETK